MSTSNLSLAPDSSQVDKFILQRAAGELLPSERVALCCKRVVSPSKTVKVFYNGDRQRAHFSGLMVCDSVWTCMLCACRVSEKRRKELSEAILAHPELVPVLGTFTVPHHRGERAAVVLARLKRAFHRFLGGRAWMALKDLYDVVGWIVNLDMTYTANGWHWHYHVLFFCAWGSDLASLPDSELDNYKAQRMAHLELDFWLRWRDVCASDDVGVERAAFDVRASDSDIADYVNKYGRMPKLVRRGGKMKWTVSDELTKSVVKRARGEGRTQWQLLGDYALGDAAAGELFKEYAAAVKGTNLLRWSRGLRSLLGLGVEQNACDLAAEDDAQPGLELLAELSLAQWRCVLQNDARGQLKAVADTGDRPALFRFLRALPGYPEFMRVNEHKGK